MFRSLSSLRFNNSVSIIFTSIRCNGIAYEPYAGVDLESTVNPPLLGELPEEYTNADIPEGTTLLNFKEMGMGSIMCVPNDWHLAETQQPLPDQLYHTDITKTWTISKQDGLSGETVESGVNIRSFKHIIGAPHHLIDSMEEDLFGKARWHYKRCLDKGTPLDKELLLEGYGIGHIFTGAMDLDNRYRNVVELNLYQRTPHSDYPLKDYYTYTDIFYWKKERWVMSMNYQCPLDEVETVKPILDNIRNHSIFNHTSPIYRIIYPQLFSVEPYPKVQN